MMRKPAPSCPPGLETIGASVVGTCRAAFAERGAVVRGCVVLGGRGTGKTALVWRRRRVLGAQFAERGRDHRSHRQRGSFRSSVSRASGIRGQ
jgi:hypothetical protein